MNSDDFAKKHLDELGLSAAERASTAKVLQFLQKQPSVIAPIEPPPGYEQELLASLRRRLPEDKNAKKKAVAKESRGSGGFFSRPQFAWGFSAVFAAVAMLTIWNYQEPGTPRGDLLASTAVRGGQDEVDHWMASMGDSFHRNRVAHADLDTLANDLSAEDQKKAEQILRDVAQRMGMK